LAGARGRRCSGPRPAGSRAWDFVFLEWRADEDG
jgi:hypothetical protein